MDADRSRLLPVGRFAELSGLTPKTLRYYDGLGLLTRRRITRTTVLAAIEARKAGEPWETDEVRAVL